MPLEWQRVLEIAGDGSVGRPHIAQAMLEKGYISNFKEAFSRYIGDGCPAYVKRVKLTPQDAIKLIRRSGGIPVLAHPLTVSRHEELIASLAGEGLAGIEAYYGEFSADDVKKLVRLAEKYGLIATGGSDFHGINEETETPLGGADVPMEAAEKLISLAGISSIKINM